MDVFKSCIKALQNELQKKKAVQVDMAKNIRDLPSIVADPDLLQRVFMNLLDNAIKYSWSGGKANEEFVKIKANPQTDLIDVMITNWGIGIDESEYEKNIRTFFIDVKTGTSSIPFAGSGWVWLHAGICTNSRRKYSRKIRSTFGDKERTARYEGFENHIYGPSARKKQIRPV